MRNKLLSFGFLCILLGKSSIASDNQLTISSIKNTSNINIMEIILENDSHIYIEKVILRSLIEKQQKINSNSNNLPVLPFYLGNTKYSLPPKILHLSKNACLPFPLFYTQNNNVNYRITTDGGLKLPSTNPPDFNTPPINSYKLIYDKLNLKTFIQSDDNTEIRELPHVAEAQINTITSLITNKKPIILQCDFKKECTLIKSVDSANPNNPLYSTDDVIEQFKLDFNNTNTEDIDHLFKMLLTCKGLTYDQKGQPVQFIYNLHVTLTEGQSKNFTILFTIDEINKITKNTQSSFIMKFDHEGTAYSVQAEKGDFNSLLNNEMLRPLFLTSVSAEEISNDSTDQASQQPSSYTKPILIVGGIGSVIAMITAYFLFPDKMAQLLQSLKNLAFKRAA